MSRETFFMLGRWWTLTLTQVREADRFVIRAVLQEVRDGRG